VINKHFR